jgi:AraC-like DNA-binding protein
LFQILRPRLIALPESVRLLAVGSFGQQHADSTIDFIARLGRPDRTVRRWFREAGLRGLSRFSRGIRLAGALDRYRFDDADIENIAVLSAIGSASTLTRAVTKILGVTIDRVTVELTPNDVARRIASDICL